VLRDLQAKGPARPEPALVDVEQQAIPPADIVLYCARWCKDCRKARQWLEDHNLAFVEVDIDYNMAARSQVRQWAKGSLVTPVIYFDGSPILDFNEPLLQESLRRRGGG
jgi:glutaredoxin